MTDRGPGVTKLLAKGAGGCLGDSREQSRSGVAGSDISKKWWKRFRFATWGCHLHSHLTADNSRVTEAQGRTSNVLGFSRGIVTFQGLLLGYQRFARGRPSSPGQQAKKSGARLKSSLCCSGRNSRQHSRLPAAQKAVQPSGSAAAQTTARPILFIQVISWTSTKKIAALSPVCSLKCCCFHLGFPLDEFLTWEHQRLHHYPQIAGGRSPRPSTSSAEPFPPSRGQRTAPWTSERRLGWHSE